MARTASSGQIAISSSLDIFLNVSTPSSVPSETKRPSIFDGITATLVLTSSGGIGGGVLVERSGYGVSIRTVEVWPLDCFLVVTDGFSMLLSPLRPL